MKDQLSIIIAAVALAIVAVRLYQKYMKKDDQHGKNTDIKKGSVLTSSKRDDDYEPYAKK